MQASIRRAIKDRNGECHALTTHAKQRMACRGIRAAAVDAAITYGRVVHVRGADIYVIGRKEVEHHVRLGIDLDPYEGNQVVVASSGCVLTVYRNRNFRGLRPRGTARRRVVA